jgi:hypothetical protein
MRTVGCSMWFFFFFFLKLDSFGERGGGNT